MLVQSLLNLTDDQLEDVMGAVENWCRKNEKTLDSEIGQKALGLAANIRRSRGLTQTQLEQILTHDMSGDDQGL
jgi:hypothetical protein